MRGAGEVAGSTRLPRLGLFTTGTTRGRAEDAAEAQRLGGLRRKRARAVAAAYNFSRLDSIEAIRRVLEIAVLDVMGLETSIARSRVLIAAAVAAAKLHEVGDAKIAEFGRGERDSASLTQRRPPILIVNQTPGRLVEAVV